MVNSSFMLVYDTLCSNILTSHAKKAVGVKLNLAGIGRARAVAGELRMGNTTTPFST